jgi:hypothetical protein
VKEDGKQRGSRREADGKQTGSRREADGRKMSSGVVASRVSPNGRRDYSDESSSNDALVTC